MDLYTTIFCNKKIPKGVLCQPLTVAPIWCENSWGDIPRKKLVGVCGRLPKTLTLFVAKMCDIFYPDQKVCYPIYDHCGCHSCCKHSFGGALV